MKVVTLARKPMQGTVAASAFEYGAGGLAVDACRLPYETGGTAASNPLYRLQAGYKVGGGLGHENQKVVAARQGKMPIGGEQRPPNPAGRWPANLVLQHKSSCVLTCLAGCSVKLLDDEIGTLTSGKIAAHHMRNATKHGGGYRGSFRDVPLSGYGDTGTASRFFKQVKP